MSKMMIVAATSEKMLELMDKITIEEGVISFLASNKATAKGYPCMFSVEGKTTTASVKFEAKIKGLDEKGEMMPVEKISVYLPARFAGSVRAVAEQTDIVYMQFEEKQVTLLSQKPAIQIPVGFVEEPTKVKNPKTDAFSMSIPLEKISQYLPHMATTKSGIGFLPVLSGEGPILKMASTDRQNTMLTVDLSPTMVRFESKDRSEVKEEDYKPYVDAISTYLTIQPGTLIRILACNKSYNQLGISFQFDEEHKNIIGIALKWPDAIYQLRLNIQSAVDKRMYEAAFRNTETVQYEFQANSNSLRRALSVMNAGAQKVDTVKVSFEGQMMSISDMKNDNFVSAIDVKTTAESGECFYEKLSLFMNFLKPYTEDVKIYKGWCIWTKDDKNHFIHLVTLHTGPGNQSTKGEEDQEEETQEEETEESSEEDSNK